MKPATIAICNHKGGTGKTTTTYFLARHFAAAGHTPLCIDLDSQSSLTRALDGVIDHSNAIGDVLTGRTSIIKAMQAAEVDPNIGIVGTDIKLNEVAAYIQGRSPNHNYLERAIRAQAQLLSGPILIDCPPSADILGVNALVAADYLVIPVDPCVEAIAGMRRMVAMANELSEMLSKGPTVLGCIITRFNTNTVAHRDYAHEIATPGNPDVIGRIPLRQGVDAADKISAAYAEVAKQIMRRIEADNGHA